MRWCVRLYMSSTRWSSTCPPERSSSKIHVSTLSCDIYCDIYIHRVIVMSHSDQRVHQGCHYQRCTYFYRHLTLSCDACTLSRAFYKAMHLPYILAYKAYLSIRCPPPNFGFSSQYIYLNCIYETPPQLWHFQLVCIVCDMLLIQRSIWVAIYREGTIL